ncbi:DUF92 domain-containing protein, partial [Candidatus Micrarchaeota archaeon]|nr:DUF92 domain-containing protein [Candidatus Micrarchaeota archaeon]
LAFFVLAIFVTKYEFEIKRDMGLYEHERGWENVLSNGLLPAILAVLSSFIGPIPFIGALAAITADKFGSELGVLEPNKPISLFDLKPVKPGTSGAISKLGTIASLCGSAAIAFCAIFLFGINGTNALFITFFGLLGSVVDTLFGVLEERGIGTKGTTNFICSLVGALLAYFLIR